MANKYTNLFVHKFAARKYIMNFNAVNFEKLPVSINIGICRKQSCFNNGKFGVLHSSCLGNHSYTTRGNIHFYDKIETNKEKRRCNITNRSVSIVCCDKKECFFVGMKWSTCPRCMDKNKYSPIVDFRFQDTILPLIRFYAKGSDERMVCPLKSLIGPLTEVGLPEEAIVDGRIPPTDIGGQDVLRLNTRIYAGLLCHRLKNMKK